MNLVSLRYRALERSLARTKGWNALQRAKARHKIEAHNEIDAIQQEISMSKRIVICVAVAVIAAAALFGLVVCFEKA